jgi:hypothetical protein
MALPAQSWPPPSTDNGTPEDPAARTAAWTSAVVRHRATTDGRALIWAFHGRTSALIADGSMTRIPDGNCSRSRQAAVLTPVSLEDDITPVLLRIR